MVSPEYLVLYVLKKLYNFHDALEDFKVLKILMELPQHVVDDHFQIIFFDISSTCDILCFQIQVKQYYETLKPPFLHYTISENMANICYAIK